MPVADIAIDSRPPAAFGLAWRDCGRLDTRQGARHLFEAAPTKLFSEAWKKDKTRLRNTGYGFSPPKRGADDWTVCFWARPSAAAIAHAAEATAAAVEASRATDTDVEIPAPEGRTYLPYQRAGIAYAIGRDGCLLGDEMGLGKTVQAIGVANATGARTILVLCPASLKLNWMRELSRWLVADLPVHVMEGGRAAFPDVGGGGVVVVNYDVLHAYTADVRSTTWDLLIGDEAHFLKGKENRRTRAVFGGPKTKKIEELAPISARRRLLLTGTPMNNRPIELFTLLHYLDPVAWPNRFKYGQRYCNGHQTRFGWDCDGSSHQAELQERLRSTVMVRRLKSEVLVDLPAKLRQVLPLPADTAALRKLLRDEQAAHDAWQGLRDARDAGADAAFDQLSRLREQVGLAKAPLIAEHIHADAGPVVAFAHHHSVVAAIEAALVAKGRKVVVVMGDMDAAARQASVDAFQGGEADVILGTLGAMGVGLTLTRSAHVVIGELDWVPSTISQAEDRCHRIGQQGSVHVEHLVFEGSLDSRLVEVLIDKQRVLDAVLDDRPVPSPAPSVEGTPAPTTAPSLADVAPALDDDAIAEIEAAAIAAVAAKAEADAARRRDREERDEAQRREDAMEVPEILDALRATLAGQGWSISRENWERAQALAACDDLTGSECGECFALIARMATNAGAAGDCMRAAEVEAGDLARAADPEVRAIALEECRRLSALDVDHAAEENRVGWSKSTSPTGHALAAQDDLDIHDAAVALGLLRIHSRQLDSLVRDRLFEDAPAIEGTSAPAPEPEVVPAPEVVEVPEPPVPLESEAASMSSVEGVADAEPARAARPGPSPASALLAEVSEAMYGSRWQTDLADALGVNVRTVRRWLAGDTPVPDDLWSRLDRLAQRREDALRAARARMPGAVPAEAPALAEPVRRRPDLPAPGASTDDYLTACVVALHADRGRRELSQYEVMRPDDLAYLRAHHGQIVVEPCGISGLLMARADPEAELEFVNRVAAIVSASVDATVAAGRKPAWVSPAQADAAIERAGVT